MSMSLKTRQAGDVTILDASGRLVLGESTAAFRDTISALIDAGVRRLLLNLAGVTYIDSAGLGELTAARLELESVNGEMKLLNLGRHAHNLMKLTKLHTIFESFEDEGSAIRSFSRAPALLSGNRFEPRSEFFWG